VFVLGAENILGLRVLFAEAYNRYVAATGGKFNDTLGLLEITVGQWRVTSGASRKARGKQ
jgi:hypothetical protein